MLRMACVRLAGVLALACVLCGSTGAYGGTSTVFGGSLLEEGEVTLTFGGGFPDVLFQFDFANSRSFNLAFRGKFSYSIGFPFFGLYGSVSAPLRFGIVKAAASKFKRGDKAPSQEASRFTLALQIEPGALLGSGSSVSIGNHQFLAGFLVGVGVLMSYQLQDRLHLNFGLDLPVFFTFEPGNARNVPFGFNLPMELFFGAEFELNENFALFGRLSVGPVAHFGNLAGTFTSADVAVHGTARLWLGLLWRR